MESLASLLSALFSHPPYEQMKERAENQLKTKKNNIIESVKVEISSPCFNGVTYVNNEFHMPVKWLGTVF